MKQILIFFLICFTFLGGGFVLLFNGEEIYGGILFGVSLGMPLTMALVRFFEQQEEKENKKRIDELPN